MSSIPNIFPPNKISKYRLTAYFILITWLILQSTFAFADSCSDNDAASATNILIIEQPRHVNMVPNDLVLQKVLLEQNVDNDYCVDCTSTCCSCCANIMLKLDAIAKNVDSPKLPLFGPTRILLDTPYYSILRPPKH